MRSFLRGLIIWPLILFPVLGRTEDPAWLKGYAKTVSGETIGYHSPYPQATSALLVRATDGAMAVEWETEPLPADFNQPSATFIWMSGLATQKGAHRFLLSANGTPLLSFRTGKDATEKTWEIAGKDGSSLSFKTTLVDQFQELFGFMFLKLPRSMLTPGRPVRLKVVGEKGDSPDWFMVFQYDLRPFVRANGEPALVRFEGRLCQPVRVEISHIAPPVEAVVSAEGGGSQTIRLETGYNAVYFPVPAVSEWKRISVGVEVAGRTGSRESVEVRPVVRRTIYLLPHSHVDIGYSDPQAVVEKNHWKYLEQAIDLARRTADYPVGARFKWNVEVLWAVETYLRQASPEKKRAFIDAVNKGWIGLQALPANMLTGICLPEELFRMTGFARSLARDYRLTINSAMITDIPSYSWSIVPALVQCGVKYFSSGPNYMPNLPDGGDRIGNAMKAWADKPFYWVSPSRREKLLFWMAGRGYSWFHGLNMGSLGLDKREPVFNYMRELEDTGYPYEMVQVRYTTGGDNGPPDPKLSDTVRAWNEQFESPRIVVATSQEMFEEFERRYGDKIPSIRGDFTPYWEDGAASTAREVALNRTSTNRLLQAETLWALGTPGRFPAGEFAEAWRQVVLWDEHTWGAADSVSNPDGENARSQWAYKQSFAIEGDKRSKALLERALGGGRRAEAGAAIKGRAFGSPLARGLYSRASTAEVDPRAKPGALTRDGNTRLSTAEADPQTKPGAPAAAPAAVDIWNTNSWEVTDVVLISPEMSPAGDRVEDADGRHVPSQRLASGELAVLAERIPAFGGRRYTIRSGQATSAGEARADGAQIWNGSIAAAVRPLTGAIQSLTWIGAGGEELVDGTSGFGLNEYLYVPGRDPALVQRARNAKVMIRDRGPLVATLVIESDAPGARRLTRVMRVYHGLDRIDLSDVIDKSRVREKESVHIAFPFRVIDGTVRLDIGWGLIRPDADQIAGSCKDFFGVQAADVSNSRMGLTWVSLDAPLVEAGEVTDETLFEKSGRRWRTEIGPTQTLYSYAMNNYWHTNYRADQEGPVTLRYSIRPHGAYNSAEVVRFGLERTRPLLAAAADSSKPLPKAPFTIASTTVVATSLQSAEPDFYRALLLRLYNPSGIEADAVISTAAPRGRPPLAMFRSDPFGNPGSRIMNRVRMKPWETITIRIAR